MRPYWNPPVCCVTFQGLMIHIRLSAWSVIKERLLTNFPIVFRPLKTLIHLIVYPRIKSLAVEKRSRRKGEREGEGRCKCNIATVYNLNSHVRYESFSCNLRNEKAVTPRGLKWPGLRGLSRLSSPYLPDITSNFQGRFRISPKDTHWSAPRRDFYRQTERNDSSIMRECAP